MTSWGKMAQAIGVETHSAIPVTNTATMKPRSATCVTFSNFHESRTSNIPVTISSGTNIYVTFVGAFRPFEATARASSNVCNLQGRVYPSIEFVHTKSIET